MWRVPFVLLLASIVGSVACLVLHFATYAGFTTPAGGLGSPPMLCLFCALFPIIAPISIAGIRLNLTGAYDWLTGLPHWARIMLALNSLYFLATFVQLTAFSKSLPPQDLAAYETRGLTGFMFLFYVSLAFFAGHWLKVSRSSRAP